VEIRAPSRVLAWSSKLFVPPLGWAERRAASCSYQTLSHFFPQHCSLNLWSPKLVCPDKRVCLACLSSFRHGRWLRGSSQALSLNFPNFRSGVRPAAPPPNLRFFCRAPASEQYDSAALRLELFDMILKGKAPLIPFFLKSILYNPKQACAEQLQLTAPSC